MVLQAPESVLRQCVQLKEEEEHSREAVARLEHVHLRLVMGSGVETDLDNVTGKAGGQVCVLYVAEVWRPTWTTSQVRLGVRCVCCM